MAQVRSAQASYRGPNVRFSDAILLRGLCLGLALSPCCKRREASLPDAAASGTAPLAAVAPSVPPRASAGIAFEKELQATKLPVPGLRLQRPRLAFGRKRLAQLTPDTLRLLEPGDGREHASAPLEDPRALVVTADGSWVAVGGKETLRWDEQRPQPEHLPPIPLLPQTAVFADAQVPDLLWTFDATADLPTLRSFRLGPSTIGLLLPETTVALSSPGGGVFGTSREGVWLYVTAGRIERLAPSGLRLPGVSSPQIAPPTWTLPARRLDQSIWLGEDGEVSLVQVTPSFRRGARARLPANVVSAAVGDEGRLLAAVVVSQPGPRFQLVLLDAQLAELAKVELPSEAPTGASDWVKTVTANQTVVAAALDTRVAVGGPGRVAVFDAAGHQVFSIPSR